MNRWPHQELVRTEVPRLIESGSRKVCVTSPTGGGKTTMICDLIEWALERNWRAILYTNRRLLIRQLVNVLRRHGIDFGVRASGHRDQRELPVQISSLPTEMKRTLKTEEWQIHGHGDGERLLAIVDEAHLNKSDTAATILGKHHETGGAYVGFTATPVDLGHLYDSLLVAGTPSELRKCGALVPAHHYGPDEPDMERFKPNVKTGEYTEGDIKKAIMTKAIFSRVYEQYQQLNPDRRPTLLFAPGVPESIWFAEQLSGHGIKAAHIDSKGFWRDGEYTQTNDPEARQPLLSDLRRGALDVICNRFVLREGLDLPEVSHLILATVMGSLQTYLQSVGRGLRACAGKDRCTIQDHGGHWHRHGSANMDRDWFLNRTEAMIAGLRADQLRQKQTREPIRCAKCSMIRASGSTCPQCGFVSSKGSRMVIQSDGKLREHTGDIYKPRRVLVKNDTIKLWTSTYHRAFRSRNRMTFRQAEGLFAHENHYWPPRDLPFMPKSDLDWFRPVADVPRGSLT